MTYKCYTHHSRSFLAFIRACEDIEDLVVRCKRALVDVHTPKIYVNPACAPAVTKHLC